LITETLERIIKPTVAGMAAAGTPFRGVLYAGLMITARGPELIEYNVRFGDPEAQVLVMRLKSDLLPALKATADGALAGVSLEWHDAPALTVVMAAAGYPGTPRKGDPIRGLDGAAATSDTVVVFHAGTLADGDTIVANGGRVLAVTARGATFSDAQARAYGAVKAIDWPTGFCRSDIGYRAIARERGSSGT
ncbi:MAG: phosphoribosylglycinamide synthetase C domain-containing protein, partial [Pseudomonadota bacterium]